MSIPRTISHSYEHNTQPNSSSSEFPKESLSLSRGLWDLGKVCPKFKVAESQHLRETAPGEPHYKMTTGNVYYLPIASVELSKLVSLFLSQDFTGKLICIYFTLHLKPLFSGNLQIYNIRQPSGLIRFSRFSKDHKQLFTLPLLLRREEIMKNN